MVDGVKIFLDTFDFDRLLIFFATFDPIYLMSNPIIAVPVAIAVITLLVPSTRDGAVFILWYLFLAVYFFLALIIAKNSDLGRADVFLYIVFSGFFATGLFLWNYMLKR